MNSYISIFLIGAIVLRLLSIFFLLKRINNDTTFTEFIAKMASLLGTVCLVLGIIGIALVKYF